MNGRGNPAEEIGSEREDEPQRGVLSRRAALATSGIAGAALVLDRMNRPPVADAASLEPNNAPPNSGIYYPEDYAQPGDPDDAAMLQRCIDAVAAAGGGTIQLGPRVYGVSSAAPRTDRNGNAIIALPHTGVGTLRIQGVPGLTYIGAVGSSPQTYSATNGCPSVLGGPTPESMGVNGQGNPIFSRWNVQLAGLTVKTPSAPSIAGIDLSRHVCCEVSDVTVVAASVSDQMQNPQSNWWSFGLRLPDALNHGRIKVDEVDVYGFYVGIVCNTAHTQIRHAITKWCFLGIGLQGSNIGSGSHDPHPSVFTYLETEHCRRHIAGWLATGGGTPGWQSLPVNKRFFVTILTWDIEDAPAGFWYSTAAGGHLIDANNQIYGSVNYLAVAGGNPSSWPIPLNKAGTHGTNTAFTNIAA